ncbi:hypothetical protein, partial [Arthrobacter sp. JCM 19049]
GAHAPVPADGEPAAVDAESDTLLSKARKTAQRVQSSDADLINPKTGQIPVTRKERREVEEMLKKEKPRD